MFFDQDYWEGLNKNNEGIYRHGPIRGRGQRNRDYLFATVKVSVFKKAEHKTHSNGVKTAKIKLFLGFLYAYGG